MARHAIIDLADQPYFSSARALLSARFTALGILLWRILREGLKLAIPPWRIGWSSCRILISSGSINSIVGVGLLSVDHWRSLNTIRNGEARVVSRPVQNHGLKCDWTVFDPIETRVVFRMA